jgi:hypothetical protein
LPLFRNPALRPRRADPISARLGRTMSSATPVPTPSPSHRPLALRIFETLILLGLSLAWALILDLLLLTFFPGSHVLFERLLDGRAPVIQINLFLALPLLAASFLVFGYAIGCKPTRSVRYFVRLALVVAALVVGNLLLAGYSPVFFNGLSLIITGAFAGTAGVSLAIIAGMALAAGVLLTRRRPFSRRDWVIVGQALAALFAADLLIAIIFPSIGEAFTGISQRYVRTSSTNPPLDLLLLPVLLVSVPAAVFGLLAALRRRSRWWILGAGLTAAPVLAYLAVDDPTIRRPVTIEEIAPAFPGAEKSFEVLMRYGSRHPLAKNFREPSRRWRNPPAVNESLDADKPEPYRRWLLNHRADITADWEELAPVRAWCSELNSFDRIGDLTPARPDAELPSFQVQRAVSQYACYIASLQALDGNGDAAVDTLLPILQVSRKLQPSARTLLRQMIATVIERLAMSTASFILDHATLSPSARARLFEALAVPGGGAAGARRLIAVEAAQYTAIVSQQSLPDIVAIKYPWLSRMLRVLSPLVYNPRASFNLYNSVSAEMQDLAGNRQLDQFEALQKRSAEDDFRPRFKNLSGRFLLKRSTPVFSKIVSSYWKTQDMRAALLERLGKM